MKNKDFQYFLKIVYRKVYRIYVYLKIIIYFLLYYFIIKEIII